MRGVRHLEKEHGDLHKLIPPLVNEQGQHATAKQLGVSVSTINNWLMRNGYVLKRQYVRNTGIDGFLVTEGRS